MASGTVKHLKTNIRKWFLQKSSVRAGRVLGMTLLTNKPESQKFLDTGLRKP